MRKESEHPRGVRNSCMRSLCWNATASMHLFFGLLKAVSIARGGSHQVVGLYQEGEGGGVGGEGAMHRFIQRVLLIC